MPRVRHHRTAPHGKSDAPKGIVPCKIHRAPIHLGPDLGEGGIQVDIHPGRCPLHQVGAFEMTGEVQKKIRTPGKLPQRPLLHLLSLKSPVELEGTVKGKRSLNLDLVCDQGGPPRRLQAGGDSLTAFGVAEGGFQGLGFAAVGSCKHFYIITREIGFL